MKAALIPVLAGAALALSACGGGSETATPVDNGAVDAELNAADVALPAGNLSDPLATDLNATEPLPAGNKTDLNVADTSLNAL